MRSLLRIGVLFGLALAILLVAGCAISTRAKGTFATENSHWQGRLAVNVQSTPVQAFSADFELDGDPNTGSLVFSTPLGNTLARLRWDASGAELQARGESRRFESLEALTLHTTGAVLPIASLFSWLTGGQAGTPEWVANLQELSGGRISARRVEPAPVVDLKIILEP